MRTNPGDGREVSQLELETGENSQKLIMSVLVSVSKNEAATADETFPKALLCASIEASKPL